ncbi:AAA family ATPase [Clostridioides difficile]|nr:AAA family ATPase [Clostridioides difficile]
MELVYLYVEEYGNLKNKEFNFNPKHRFHYDSVKKELHYTPNEDFPINIFDNLENKKDSRGHISNVTAIVGDNGSGKTTLLNFITEYLSMDIPTEVENSTEAKNEILGIVLDNEALENQYKMKLYFTTKSSICFKYEEDILNPICEPKKINNDKTKIIYFSNNFDLNRRISSMSEDISINGLILRDKQMSYQMHTDRIDMDSNTIFFYKDFLRQLDFIYKYNFEKISSINLPKYMVIRPKDCDFMLKEMLKKLDEGNDIKKELRENFNYIYVFLNNCSKKSFLDRHLSKGMLTSILKQIIPYVTGGETYNTLLKMTKEFIKSINDNFSDLCKENPIKYVQKLICYIKKYYPKLTINTTEFKEVINFFLEKNTDLMECDDMYEIIKVKLVDNEKEIKRFYSYYRKAVFEYGFLDFSWNLSTGENNMLSMFARFFSLLDERKLEKNIFCFKDNCENLIILIDEADITFHPKWQQKYLKLLMEFLQDIYENCNMQLIITTHSPIILSDIPLCNTIYLSDDSANNNHIETFGANIYSIYNNSFFLDKNNIGMLGELSKYHINKANNILKGYYNLPKSVLLKYGVDFNRELKESIEKDLDYCKKIINLVGEEIIRQSLLKKYNYIRKNLYPEENDNKKLQNIIDQYDTLNKYEKEELISYIIKKEDKDRG